MRLQVSMRAHVVLAQGQCESFVAPSFTDDPRKSPERHAWSCDHSPSEASTKQSNKSRCVVDLGHTVGFSRLRSGRMNPDSGALDCSRAFFEVETSHDSGTRDPRSGIVPWEVMRTDRVGPGPADFVSWQLHAPHDPDFPLAAVLCRPCGASVPPRMGLHWQPRKRATCREESEMSRVRPEPILMFEG